MRKRLNIFIDESGDFGLEDGSSKLYCVSFTVHDSSDNIEDELDYLNNKLKELNFTGMIHMADLIAKRNEYQNFTLEERKAIFWAIYYFAKRVKVRIHTCFADKNYMNNRSQLNKALAIQMNEFFNSISDLMDEYEKVVIYYDEGQAQLGAIIDTLMITKNNIDRRTSFDKVRKRLFQVSDMLTYIDKMNYKRENKIEFTKAEKYFFQGKDFRHIINNIKRKRI